MFYRALQGIVGIAIALSLHPTASAGEPVRSVLAGTIAEMTYVELETAAREGAVALWALGAIEEHGPHLPLATDVYVPTAQLRQAQKKLAAQKISSVIVPAYYWGVNNVTGAFPGSIHIRPEIMVEVMTDVFRSLARAGFKEIFCITGHYDAAHGRAVIEAVRRANQAGIIKAYFVVPKPLGTRLGLEQGEAGFLLIDPSSTGPVPAHPDLHAGEGETSAILAVAPDLVHKDVASKLPSTDLTAKDVEEWRKGQERAKQITPQGYLGAPARADAAVGAARIELEGNRIAEAIASAQPH
jgi:creatinine amidohydrolase